MVEGEERENERRIFRGREEEMREIQGEIMRAKVKSRRGDRREVRGSLLLPRISGQVLIGTFLPPSQLLSTASQSLKVNNKGQHVPLFHFLQTQSA